MTTETTTLSLIRSEAAYLLEQIKGERDPERIRALGEVLERINDRHERLEREILAEPDDPQARAIGDLLDDAVNPPSTENGRVSFTEKPCAEVS